MRAYLRAHVVRVGANSIIKVGKDAAPAAATAAARRARGGNGSRGAAYLRLAPRHARKPHVQRTNGQSSLAQLGRLEQLADGHLEGLHQTAQVGESEHPHKLRERLDAVRLKHCGRLCLHRFGQVRVDAARKQYALNRHGQLDLLLARRGREKQLLCHVEGARGEHVVQRLLGRAQMARQGEQRAGSGRVLA